MGGAGLDPEARRDQHLYPERDDQESPLRRLCVAVAGAVGVLSLPSVALAHADVRDSSPAAGTTVTKPPKEVTLILAEPSAEGSTLVVTDGCGEEVSGALDIRRDILETPIAGGRPGRWLVELRSISAEDGHAIEESFTFKVEGQKDCNQGTDDIEPETDISPDTSSRPPIDNPEEEGTSFPVTPFLLGTVAVVAVALAVRRPRDKS